MGSNNDELVRILCDNCGAFGFHLEVRMVAKPVGRYSLAGAQMKFSAVPTPFLVCDAGCGRESQGAPFREIAPPLYPGDSAVQPRKPRN